MSRKGGSIVWVTMLFFVLVALIASVQAQSPSEEGTTQTAIESSHLISLQYGEIDTRIGPKDIPSLLSIQAYGEHEAGYYIVQFDDVILPEWRTALESAGAEIMGYVPNNAFLVRISGAESVKLSGVEHVQWVGIYQPAYRILPELISTPDEQIVLTIMTFPNAGLDQLVSQLEDWGGKVVASFETELAGRVRVEIGSNYIEQIARYNGVMWIEPWTEPQLTNDVAREIMEVEDIVWNTHGLYGSGQIVGIADTGLDIGQNNASMNDDFEGRIFAAYGRGRPGDWSDPDGHGTHVAGSVLGNGASSGSDPNSHNYINSNAGIAPEAGLVFQSTLAADGLLSGIPANLNELFQQAYADNARIHSNSWGQVSGTWGMYNEYSFTADEFAWNNPDMLIIFAAGNNGTDANNDGQVDNDSIGWPGTAKNVLTVGATENNRPTGGRTCETWGCSQNFPANPIRDDRISDNPQGMAAFSSRGPVAGNRIKPDMVAPGTNILSVRTHQHTLEMDAEGGDNGWTADSPWFITDAQANSGSHSWTTGAYGNNVDASLTSPTTDIRTGANAITFWTRYDLGAGDDGFVEYFDGSNWVECALLDAQADTYTINGGLFGNTQDQWVFLYCILPIQSQNFQFRFRFDSNFAFTGDGWFVDNIRITPLGWGYQYNSGVPDENYFYSGGTSMATPLVAGGAALVREYYTERLAHMPSSALMRATLVNGANNIAPGQYTTPQEIPNNVPNNVTGWGRVNLENTLYPSTSNQSIAFVDVSNAEGLNATQSHVYEYTVDHGNVPFRATLVWTDFPGLPLGNASINHDLDLVIEDPVGTIYYGNGGTAPDRNNNTEDIVIDSGNAMLGTYVITVTAHTVPSGPQGYGLVIRGGLQFDIIDPVNVGATPDIAYAGPHDNPTKIIVRVTKPSVGLTRNDFIATIGGKQASVVTAYEAFDEYVLEVLPPNQDENGLYELTVAATTNALTVSDVEVDVIFYDDTNNVDVSLVIDRSGSMGYGFYGPYEYMQPAKDAATLFANLMKDDDQLAVVSFDDIVEVPHPMAPLNPTIRTAAIQAIDSLTARGTTSIGGGLQGGQNQLLNNGQATHPWAIVLLSDGQENTAPFVQNVLPGIVASKTIVHTVAMGPDSDQTLLLNIASQTGGTYNYIPNPTADQSRLQGIYNTISAAVSGQQTLLSVSDIIPVGATSVKQVVVDSTVGEATFSISWGNFSSAIGLTLQDPNGNLIDPTAAAFNSDITYVTGNNFVYYRIKSPTLVSGVWSIVISGGSIPTAANSALAVNEDVSYSLLVTGSVRGAAVALNLYLDQVTYDISEPIKVAATLSDDQPITGAEIIAIVGNIVAPSSPAQAKAVVNNPILILYDDGLHGDGQANDGVYANILEGSNTTNAGVYDFQVFTTGTNNDGEAFSRLTRYSVNVGLDENSFTSNLNEFAHMIYLPVLQKP